MSERQPNPDKEPKPRKLKDNCVNCNKDYRITPDNSRLHHYSDQPDCDYLFCTCPNCETSTRIFIGEETFQQAVDNGLEMVVEKYAPEAIYNSWLMVNGIELVETYDLTDRHEEIVRKFGETMMAIADKAPDLFWDEMNSPQGPQTMPEKWI